jgi:hypothetical protein
MVEMTEEMILAAEELHAAAKKYRDLYEAKSEKTPVVWVTHDDTGESVFIADSFNSGLMKSRLSRTVIAPILNNHIHTIEPIGFVELIDGTLHFRFRDDVSITLDMVYQIFGNVGIKVLDTTDDKDGLYVIRSGQILEWSIGP